MRAPPLLHIGLHNSRSEAAAGTQQYGSVRITLFSPYWLNNRTGGCCCRPPALPCTGRVGAVSRAPASWLKRGRPPALAGVDLMYRDQASVPRSPFLLGFALPWDHGEVFTPGAPPQLLGVVWAARRAALRGVNEAQHFLPTPRCATGTTLTEMMSGREPSEIGGSSFFDRTSAWLTGPEVNQVSPAGRGRQAGRAGRLGCSFSSPAQRPRVANACNPPPLTPLQALLEYKLVLMNKQEDVELGLAHVPQRRYSPGIKVTTVGAWGSAAGCAAACLCTRPADQAGRHRT